MAARSVEPAQKQFKIIFRKQKYGMTASSYHILLEKCKSKFDIKKECKLTLCYEDHTEIDEDFFPLINEGETLILHTTDNRELLIESVMKKLEEFIRECLNCEPNISEQLQTLISMGKVDNFQDFVASLPVVSAEAKLSNRNEHPDWFEGISSRHQSKEGVMRGSAECRMRSYMQSLQKELRLMLQVQARRRNEVSLPRNVEEAIRYFSTRLKACKYNAHYFDRSHAMSCCRMCNADGAFLCGGAYNKHQCSDHHTINPYATRHHRVVFSTWNLDHMIEKSRSVIPVLKQALKTCAVELIDLDYFFELLFTKHETSRAKCEDPSSSSSSSSSLPSSYISSSCTPAPASSFSSWASDEQDGRMKRQKMDLDNSNGQSIHEVSFICAENPANAKEVPVIQELISENQVSSKNMEGSCDQKNKNGKSADELPSADEVEGNVCRSNKRKDLRDDKVETISNRNEEISVATKQESKRQTRAALRTKNIGSKIPTVSYVRETKQAKDASSSCPPSGRSSSCLDRCEGHKPGTGNLKLVHIACHVKLPHNLACDPRRVYR